MKATYTIDNRAKFISYRSQLITDSIGKHLFLAFAMMGCIAFTQLSTQNISAFTHSSLNSITLSEEVNEIEQEMIEETIPELK